MLASSIWLLIDNNNRTHKQNFHKTNCLFLILSSFRAFRFHSLHYASCFSVFLSRFSRRQCFPWLVLLFWPYWLDSTCNVAKLWRICRSWNLCVCVCVCAENECRWSRSRGIYNILYAIHVPMTCINKYTFLVFFKLTGVCVAFWCCSYYFSFLSLCLSLSIVARSDRMYFNFIAFYFQRSYNVTVCTLNDTYEIHWKQKHTVNLWRM